MLSNEYDEDLILLIIELNKLITLNEISISVVMKQLES
jgi:hypothetical protein